MLYISCIETPDTIISPDVYFNNTYDPEWFNDEFVKSMVLDVDKTEVISTECARSPVLGVIPITKISGGVKALILLYKRPDLKIWGTACGDNCAKWFLKIAEMHDIHVVFTHIMHFRTDFEVVFEDDNTKTTTYMDYFMKSYELLTGNRSVP